MRTVTVSQIDTEIDGATETYLFNAIQTLERLCDSLLKCRVEIEGGTEIAGTFKQWHVKLLLSTCEHDIFVEGHDDCRNAAAPTKAIRSAVRQAELALLGMKNRQECTACCDQLSDGAFAH